jgi:hypothetical protein
MKKGAAKSGRLVLALFIALSFLAPGVARAQTEQQKQEREQLKKEVKEEIKKEFEEAGMPMLTGSIWQNAAQENKVAFVWGICHVLTVEKVLAQKLPSLKVENFSAKAAEGLAGLKINDIVSGVDEYYTANPAQIEVPVVQVIWVALIKPRLKTGIAGYPLQQLDNKP